MADTGFVLQFLRELQRNNSKAWMDAHREQYIAARQHFSLLVEETIQGLTALDAALAGVTATDSMFRINKNDFSKKEEAPYKGRMGAGISPGGRHSAFANYILVLEPGNKSRVGGGMYSPSAKALQLIRQEIDYSPGELEQILEQPAFKEAFGELQGGTVKSTPKGYSKTHPSIALLKHKGFLALHYFTDEDVCAPSFSEKLLPLYQRVKPFTDFLNRPIAEL